MITGLLHKTRYFGLVTLSLASLAVLSACDADKSVSNSNKNGDEAFFSVIPNGTPGRSVLNFDLSSVTGYLAVTVANASDSKWGSGINQTSLNAACGNAEGNPIAIVNASANGVALSQLGSSNNILGNDAPQTAITAGGAVNWNVHLADGVSFIDNIIVPIEPKITNLLEYQSYDISGGLNVQWVGGGDPNAEAVISVTVDPTITASEGGDVSQLNRAANPTLVYTETTNDVGNFTIPAADLAGFPNNVYARITVQTYAYQTKPRSDGKLFGLIARSLYSVPIKLTKVTN